MRNYLSIFLQNKRTFVFLTLTFTLLFLGINLILLSKHNARHTESDSPNRPYCIPPDSLSVADASQGHMWLTASNLPFLVDELMRINRSVHNELIELHARRRDVLNSTAAAQARMDHVRTLLFDHNRRFLRLRASLHSYENKLKDVKHDPVVFHKTWPAVVVHEDPVTPDAVRATSCNLDTCVNWHLCPLGSHLRLCGTVDSSVQLVSQLKKTGQFQSSCSSPTEACLRLTADVPETLTSCQSRSDSPTCLAVLTEPTMVEQVYRDPVDSSKPSAVFILASPYFPPNRYRPGYDLLIPVPFDLMERGYGIRANASSVRLIPGRRPILLAFSAGRTASKSTTGAADDLDAIDAAVVKSLRQLAKSKGSTGSSNGLRVHMYETQKELLACWPTDLHRVFATHLSAGEGWFPCHNSLQLLSNSTFGLVLNTASGSADLPASAGWHVQLVLSLASGAIPVMLGSAPLPFGEAISSDQWSKVLLRVPRGRVHELTAILQSIPDHHLVEMRRQGQLLYRRHFQGLAAQADSLLLAVSRRLGLPQPPATPWPSKPAFANAQYAPPKHYSVSPDATYQTDFDNFLGPVGPTHASPQFLANFTGPGGSAHFAVVSSTDGAELIHPFRSYPSIPWDVVMPSDAAHSTDPRTNRGLRPINHTMNLAGFEFNMDLGGMFPYEQFTVIMLVYDRFEIACRTLEGFLNLPYLHSVIVVWNHPVAPKPGRAWPQLHVPIKVIHATNNSLNNRFLPYDIIETDAILSVDDDSQLRHDEIIFGFRVWRENRDRLVGFPVRSHFWNETSKKWYYHSDYTCEFSMVLTGAAFFHRYYSYAYTFEMPSYIRQMVDRHFNCEDLAMNFLIAHLTRKPPVKATLHWSFTCPDCKTTLHDKPGHYGGRSTCMNELTEFYGYNPLIYSQYRADSVLFKTRIPSNKQKCFNYI